MTTPLDDIQPWKKLASTKALDEKWFPVRKDTVQLPSGKILDDYFVWESPDIAVIVPYTKDGTFVICQQYRYAVDKIMYQFPAGAVGKNETPEQAAVRELAEETGFASNKVSFLTKTATYATKLTGWHHMFLAEASYQAGPKQDDPEEPTKVLLVTPEELKQLIDNGEFQVPDSLVAALLVLRKLGL